MTRPCRHRVPCLPILALLGAILLGVPLSARAATIVVDDGSDTASCAGFNTLRCAIAYANANPFTNIRFAPGLPAVLLLGALPTITGNGTWIDGHDINGGCVCPRIDGAFWSGPQDSALQINANDVTISNMRIVRIPQGGADIRIVGGKDTAIASNFLGILPGATQCNGTDTDYGVLLDSNTSGASGAYNGVAYIFDNVVGCHGSHGIWNYFANFVTIGQDRVGNDLGNRIGLAPDGVHAAGNGGDGIESYGDDVTIRANVVAHSAFRGMWVGFGDRATITFNTIVNNGLHGLFVNGGAGFLVVGNLIGTTTADGMGVAANGGQGVLFSSGSGFASDNIVANNALAGFAVTGTSTHFDIQNNTVFANGGLPIDLGYDGWTRNNSQPLPGPNNWVPYPLITSAGGNIVLGTACPSCGVFVFKRIGNPSAKGGGGTFLTNVFANSSGAWAATLPSGVTRDDVTMTAHSGGGSSEMTPLFGDVNGDGAVSVLDIFYLVNYLFAGGPPPPGDGDVQHDLAVDVHDVFFLINYLFAGGPAPS